jgi:N-methylhydantoinase A
VRRPFRYEVSERMEYTGRVLRPLDEDAVRNIAQELKDKGVEAVAICYLHSYANPAHEQRTAELIRELLPDVYLTLSSDILPVIREYERTSTATINAYIMPKVQQYLVNLREKLASLGYTKDYYLMQSSGGIISDTAVATRPVCTLNSGPAGGVIAAAQLGSMLGYPDVLAFDMGGTTAKVCVIRDGRPKLTTQFWIDGKYFIGVPVLDMREIGAGGGSIVRIDQAGLVHVGPESAGADPGPACYERGGTDATVTDADLVLGYINPDYFLGGDMKVSLEAAKAAIKAKVADRLKIDEAQGAYGVYRVVNANMIGALRVVTVQRGYDPRDFSMVVSGGTGAIHAVRMAQELGIPRVIIPLSAGVFSAFGLITADARYDISRSYVARTSTADTARIRAILDEITEEAKSKIEELGFTDDQIILSYTMDMRYVGQAHEVTISVPREVVDKEIDAAMIKKLENLFHEAHQDLYGHSSADSPVEFFTISMVAIGPIDRGRVSEIEKGSRDPKAAFKQLRKVYFDEFKDYVDCPTYERLQLKSGNELVGPAVVEQMDTTTVIPPNQRAVVDDYGNIIIEVTA